MGAASALLLVALGALPNLFAIALDAAILWFTRWRAGSGDV
jgi:hypothetical protein